MDEQTPAQLIDAEWQIFSKSQSDIANACIAAISAAGQAFMSYQLTQSQDDSKRVFFYLSLMKYMLCHSLPKKDQETNLKMIEELVEKDTMDYFKQVMKDTINAIRPSANN